jgi:hypothetical protein
MVAAGGIRHARRGYARRSFDCAAISRAARSPEVRVGTRPGVAAQGRRNAGGTGGEERATAEVGGRWTSACTCVCTYTRTCVCTCASTYTFACTLAFTRVAGIAGQCSAGLRLTSRTRREKRADDSGEHGQGSEWGSRQ